MRRFDYYLHCSGGFAFDYFGGIGTPFRVSVFRAYLYKWAGYRMTRVPRGASLTRVMVRAALKSGAHRRSLFVEKARRGDCPLG